MIFKKAFRKVERIKEGWATQILAKWAAVLIPRLEETKWGNDVRFLRELMLWAGRGALPGRTVVPAAERAAGMEQRGSRVELSFPPSLISCWCLPLAKPDWTLSSERTWIQPTGVGLQEHRVEQRKVENEAFEDKWRKPADASWQDYASWLKLNSKENL